MRTPTTALVISLSATLLLPLTASAQVVEPPIRPCDLDCWWPTGGVAQLDAIDADIDVGDGSSVAQYTFTLSNPDREGWEGGPGAEGRIVFPVPAGSSVTDLVLSGGPETLEGELLDADKATRLYEDIVARLIDPALLRSLEGDLYEVRAFPVPAGEEREVSFTVTTPVVAEGDEALVEVPWSRMSPRPLSGQVSVDVDVPWEVRSAVAPGFELDEEREGPGELGIGWESAIGWSPDADFRLHLAGGEGLVDTRLLAYREGGDDDGYFSLLFAPILDIDESVARDIVLVIDRSGSMEDEKMAQAREAAEYVLDHLGDDDRFAIVDFSRYVRTFDEELRPASDTDAGIDYVRDIESGGNTNISGALERGMDFLDGERPGTVIFLTDGLPTAGIQTTDGILSATEEVAPANTQLFAFGVGYDVDTTLLDALASDFVGSSHYVLPEEDIADEVSRLYEQVSTPVLADVQISIDGVETSDLAPAEIPGLFAGNQALLTGRYEGDGPATVTIRGLAADGPQELTYDVEFPERATSEPVIAQLWAQRRVADLLTELRIEGARDSLIEEIVEVANQFGIVTPYTAYLAEEPEMVLRDADALMAVEESSRQFAAAPAAGQDAVARADELGRLREGKAVDRGAATQVLGEHTFYLLDGTWTRDDFEPGTEAPEVAVGSDEFRSLVADDPDVAAAAALGERVIVATDDGWVTIVWPDVAAE
jgi:Ca-activated chloride channel family protein